MFWHRDLIARTPLLGVDLASSSVKSVILKKRGGGFKAEFLGYSAIADGVVVGGQISKTDALVEVLTRLYRQVSGSSDLAVGVIPGATAMFKTVQMSAQLNDRDQEARAWLEIGELFPQLADNLSLDYVVLGPSARGDRQVDVLLVASRKDIVDGRVLALSKAGFQPKAVDIDYYALHRASLLLLKDQLATSGLTAVANLGTHHSSIIVFEGDDLQFSQSQPFNGLNMLSNVNVTLDSLFAVEKDKDSASDALEHLSKEALAAQIEASLVPHLRHLLQFADSSQQRGRIGRLVLSGESALLPGVDQCVSSALELDVVRAEPFVNVDIPKRMETLANKTAPAFLLSSGLSLHGAVQ